jgi:hypothetical protein
LVDHAGVLNITHPLVAAGEHGAGGLTGRYGRRCESVLQGVHLPSEPLKDTVIVAAG